MVFCLRAPVHGFSPLLFHTDDIKCVADLVKRCNKILKNEGFDEDLLDKWEAIGNHLKASKTFKAAFVMEEEEFLMQLHEINKRGKYKIRKMVDPPLDIGSSIQLDIENSSAEKHRRDGYTMNDLHDLQSKLMHIVGEAKEGKELIEEFIELMSAVETLAQTFVNLVNAGCVLFNEWSAVISHQDVCSNQNKNLTLIITFKDDIKPLTDSASIQELTDLSAILTDTLNCWKEFLGKKQMQHYFLNAYNIQQIIYLCHQLALSESTTSIPNQVYTLLSSIASNLTLGQIRTALLEAIEDDDNTDEVAYMSVIDVRKSVLNKLEKKFQFVRKLVIDQNLDEDLAKAAVQVNGCEDLDTCLHWALVNVGENIISEKATEFDVEEENEMFGSGSVLQGRLSKSLHDLIAYLQKNVKNDDLIGAVKSMCDEYHEKYSCLSFQNCLSVDHLGKFLMLIRRWAIHEKIYISKNLNFDQLYEKGKPNLILCMGDEVLSIVLSLYIQNPNVEDDSEVSKVCERLATASEVVICCEQTTEDEVERFMRRAMCKCEENGNNTFCLVFTESLKLSVSLAIENMYQALSQEDCCTEDYQLVVISCSPQHYVSRYFAKFIREKKPTMQRQGIYRSLARHQQRKCDKAESCPVCRYYEKVSAFQRSRSGETAVPIKISKTLSANIGQLGGEIKFSGSILNFPKGTFEESATVQIKLEIDASKWPKGYLGITPMLFVTADKPFRKPVSVSITSWWVNDASSDEQSRKTIDVLHLADGSSTWEVIDSLPFRNGTVYQFECLDFSPIVLGMRLREALFGSQSISVSGLLFASRNNFTFLFYPNHPLLFERVLQIMNAHGATIMRDFNTIYCHVGDRVQASISCHEEQQDFHFVPSDTFYFTVDENFKQMETFQKFPFVLNRRFAETRQILLRCDIAKNIDFVERNVLFSYLWKHHDGNAQQRPGQVNFQGDVGNVNMNYGD